MVEARLLRMTQGIFVISLVVGLASLSGIVDSAVSAQGGREPDYRRIIAEKFLWDHKPSPELDSDMVAVNRAELGPLEISKPRWVEHNLAGWVWLVCLRAHPAGKPVFDISVFISDHPIPRVGNPPMADARTSIVADACSQQAFEPYNPKPPKR